MKCVLATLQVLNAKAEHLSGWQSLRIFSGRVVATNDRGGVLEAGDVR